MELHSKVGDRKYLTDDEFKRFTAAASAHERPKCERSA